MSQNRAGVIIINGSKILLMYRKKNDSEYYCIPGGHIDQGETPEQAAVREIKEETTLDVVLSEFLIEIENQRRKEFYFFSESSSGKTKLSGEEAERNSPENVYKLEWVLLADFPKLKVYPEELQTKLVTVLDALQ
jgi:8-oxo-dGTP diphosphatase